LDFAGFDQWKILVTVVYRFR